MEKTKLASIAIILLMFGTSAYFYSSMPENMASHWNAEGQADSSLPKFWGLFMFPLISLVLYALFQIIPKIDPLKANITQFSKYYSRFVFVIFLFLIYIHLLVIAWSLNFEFNITQMIIPALGILFFFIGSVIGHAKRNWFIGIRTPWTLSNDKVWNKTHQLGEKLYKTAGVIALAGFIFPKYTLVLVIGPIILFSLFLFVYSYFEYSKLSGKRIENKHP